MFRHLQQRYRFHAVKRYSLLYLKTVNQTFLDLARATQILDLLKDLFCTIKTVPATIIDVILHRRCALVFEQANWLSGRC